MLQKNVRDKQPYIFIVEQFKRYLVTGNKYCRGEHEVTHMANTYLCLLQSSRKQQVKARQTKNGKYLWGQEGHNGFLEAPST